MNPPGAGRTANGDEWTATVEILEGHRHRDAGHVAVLGYDPATGGRDYRERIGIVLQSAGFEEDFTVRELVRLQASLYPRRHDPDELIDLVELTDKRNTRAKALSGGQRRRLDLALGLAGAPELLFLDEPTTGFDPAARHRAWELIERLRSLGTTILLTTHYLQEAERLADRVAVLMAGRLVALGTPQDLRTEVHLPTVISFGRPADVVLIDLPQLSAVPALEGPTVSVRTHDALADARRLTTWAADRRLDLADFAVEPPTLEDAYLALTGETGHAR